MREEMIEKPLVMRASNFALLEGRARILDCIVASKISLLEEGVLKSAVLTILRVSCQLIL
jgi:hypothetical protein